MKRIYVLVFSIAAFYITGCKPEVAPPIGDHPEYIKAMTGTFKLDKVTQTDVVAVKRAYPYKVADITGYYPYAEYKVTLNVDAQGKPSTFTETPGNSPALIDIPSGKWSVDNMETPGTLTFVNGTDTTLITAGSYVSFKYGKMTWRTTRYLDGKPVIYYDYEFVKQ